MSGKKFSFKDLAKWRQMQLDCFDQPWNKNMSLPIDWCEFNQMFSSKKNVILVYPPGMYTNSLMLVGFYSSLKMAKFGTSIGLCNFGSRIGFPYVLEFAKKIVNKPSMDELVLYTHESTPFQSYKNMLFDIDEWIMNADWGPMNIRGDCSGKTIMEWIDSTNGLTEFDANMDLYNSNRVLVGWEGLENPPKRKFVVAWEESEAGRNALAQVMEKYPDKFLVVDYTKEKHMVDKWYNKNETMVDPEFDIQLMDENLDKRKVLLYAATNHLYDFRQFARVLPDVVEKNITRDELRDFRM